MGAYARMKVALEAAGDAAGGLLKVLYGTTGDLEEYPTGVENEVVKASLATGALWEGLFLPDMLQAVGSELDDNADNLDTNVTAIQNTINAGFINWAYVYTAPSGNTPSVSDGRNVASASKNESTDYIQLNFSNDYDSATYFAIAMLIDVSTPAIPQLYALNASYVRFRFISHAGAVLDINNRYLVAATVGQLA
jgi:hypothetical protein